jgi:hypothetical protein
VIELADQERPPMIRIPEYLERRRGPEGSNGAAHPGLGLGADSLEPVGR